MNTLPLIFMLSMSLKTLNIILICFDGKKTFEKKREQKNVESIKN